MRKPFYPKNPNNVSLSREDARTSLGVCPLMKSSVQLVPLRYGLVDNPGLDPSGEIAMPYRLSARPPDLSGAFAIAYWGATLLSLYQ